LRRQDCASSRTGGWRRARGDLHRVGKRLLRRQRVAASSIPSHDGEPHLEMVTGISALKVRHRLWFASLPRREWRRFPAYISAYIAGLANPGVVANRLTMRDNYNSLRGAELLAPQERLELRTSLKPLGRLVELIHCPRDVAGGILVNSVDLCEANPNESVVQAWSRTSRRSTSHRNNTLTNWKDWSG
jgi:hypothetical protein